MRIFITVMLSLLTTTIYAQDLDKIELSPLLYENLITPLLVEVIEISGLKMPTDKPIVYIAHRHQIQKVYCTDNTTNCTVAAITDEETGEIYLSHALLQTNLFTVSVIFHELVHFVQIKNKLFQEYSGCVYWAKSEMHAYSLQSKFLVKHGTNGFVVPNLLDQCK